MIVPHRMIPFPRREDFIWQMAHFQRNPDAAAASAASTASTASTAAGPQSDDPDYFNELKVPKTLVPET